MPTFYADIKNGTYTNEVKNILLKSKDVIMKLMEVKNDM